MITELSPIDVLYRTAIRGDQTPYDYLEVTPTHMVGKTTHFVLVGGWFGGGARNILRGSAHAGLETLRAMLRKIAERDGLTVWDDWMGVAVRMGR